MRKNRLKIGLFVAVVAVVLCVQIAYAQDHDPSQLSSVIEVCFNVDEHCFPAQSIIFSASQTATLHIGGGAGAGKASIDDILLVRAPDSFSPKLFLLLAQGTHMQDATINIKIFSGEGGLTDFMQLTLDPVMITNLSIQTLDGKLPREELALNFSNICISVQDGEKTCWNVETNSKK